MTGYPLDPNSNQISMVPLIEPCGKYASNYPSSYPDKLAGETPHSCMGNQITARVKGKFGPKSSAKLKEVIMSVKVSRIQKYDVGKIIFLI
ncbi:hypothetical protein [Pseudobacteroides cellulosolvens]|uniref:Uncharacterized protein n=2 Tax=Pseudobacteroides cellulosolvens TaxID=35825 RepID=A0A0L6JLE7_9FIRM|nr:hypothetical protein [Pseudobacteroides cellulosolvens]KNY26651.1 hypothetical protein Bccel_1916 [Pseudobacteroides cellulosolvens ATCC 35603 = DSM 2933]